MDTLIISNHEKNFIIDGVQDGMRNDGRGPNDYRPIAVETGVLCGCNGSARVQLGATDVLVAVKAEMTVLERSDELAANRRIRFFVDISANAGTRFAGKGGNEAAELMAKCLHAAYDNDSVLPDMARLVLAPTQLWCLYVDATLLQYDGNAMDALSLGVKAALADMEICNVVVRPADEGRVHVDLPEELSTWQMDVSGAPLVIAVNRIGDQCVLDADLMEEACTSSTLFVGVKPPPQEKTQRPDDCMVTCLKKVRGGSLEVGSVDAMIAKATVGAVALNRALMRRILAIKSSGNDWAHQQQRHMSLFRAFSE